MNRVRIGSDNGLSPSQCQAIIWTNAGLLSIGPKGSNFSEISIKKKTFHSQKRIWKYHLGYWQPFCPGEDELISWLLSQNPGHQQTWYWPSFPIKSWCCMWVVKNIMTQAMIWCLLGIKLLLAEPIPRMISVQKTLRYFSCDYGTNKIQKLIKIKTKLFCMAAYSNLNKR